VIEQEIKLRFDTLEAARVAVITAGGRLTSSRRLIDDRLFDTQQEHLRAGSCALRVRRDGAVTYLTYKGAPMPGAFKTREEIETTAGDAATVEAILESLGFTAKWRAQKFREEYAIDAAKIAIDETPMGTFVEIEGTDADITRIAAALGRMPADYVLSSYARLFNDWCTARGQSPGDMLVETR
jgi:adenylate cyclase class 2